MVFLDFAMFVLVYGVRPADLSFVSAYLPPSCNRYR